MPTRPHVKVLDRLITSSPQSLFPPMQCVPHVCRGKSVRQVESLLFLSRRKFSTSERLSAGTVRRRNMIAWLQGQGEDYREARRRCNYIGRVDGDQGSTTEMIEEMMDEVRAFEEAEKKGLNFTPTTRPRSGAPSSEGADEGTETSITNAKPFPVNPYFISHPVLSEKTKDAIVKMVTKDKKSIREASVRFGVEMGRVGAVLRLKAIEKQWSAEGKPIAQAYAEAIQGMLPVTGHGDQHESINDINSHRSTKEQMFYPATESRVFTRKDASEVLEKGLSPADERIPHPQLVQMHRDRAAIGVQGKNIPNEGAVQSRLQQFYEKELQERQSRADRKKATVAANTQEVEGLRAIFRISNVIVDESTVGRDGKGKHGVGARYGIPHEDRKKGKVKIPTKWGVEE